MAGHVGPLNSAFKMWGDANQLDVTQFLLPAPDPNAPQPPSEAEVEMQTEQAKLAMDERRMEVDVAGKQAELGMKAVDHQQDLAFDAARFSLEMRHDAQKSKQELAILKQKGQAQIAATRAKAKSATSKAYRSLMGRLSIKISLSSPVTSSIRWQRHGRNSTCRINITMPSQK